MFSDTDLVAEIGLSVEAADLGSAASTVARLADESGATAVEFRAADPHGGRSGFLATLIVARPVTAGPGPARSGRAAPGPTGQDPTHPGPATSDRNGRDPADPVEVAGRIREVAAQLLAAWGLPARHFFRYDSPHGPVGSYEGPERAAADHTVLWLTVHTGRAAAADRPDGLAGTGRPPSGWRHRRVLPLPACDDDIVVRVHAVLPAGTPGAAARACLPLADALDAGAIEILPAAVLDAGAAGYAVALLSTLHADLTGHTGGTTPGEGTDRPPTGESSNSIPGGGRPGGDEVPAGRGAGGDGTPEGRGAGGDGTPEGRGAGTGAVAREGEVLLHAVLSAAGRLGIGGASPTVLARDNWLVGVLEFPSSRPAASLPGIGVQAVYARRAVDPFGAVDAFAAPETRELVTDEVRLSDEEIADIAELVRLLDPGAERPGGATP